MVPFWSSGNNRSYLGIVCTIFCHPQNGQEGQEYLKDWVLEDFGCIDEDYDIVTLIYGRLVTQQKWNTGRKKLKIRGKIQGFNKPKIQGNTMKLSSNTGGKIHVYVVY